MIAVTDPDLAAGFRAFVDQWFRALAQGQWDAAVAMLDEPNSNGLRWSESRLQAALTDYSPGGKVSDPADLATAPRVTFGEFDDGSGYWLDCDVPLNGAWSDLTVQFEFKHRRQQYAVILHDIHVL